MRIVLTLAALCVAVWAGEAKPREALPQEKRLKNIRQLTFGGENAEAYWSFDEKRLIFQSTRPPFKADQIFVMNADGSGLKLVSTGKGRTTCAYFLPGDKRILYASTHGANPEPPKPPDRSRGYVWPIYSSYDIWVPADGDAEVPLAAQILVQFSRSVAALTTLDARDDAPVIEFDPPLAGSGEWLNTSLYRFIPDELAPSTSYEARIAAGLTSAADGVLEADYSWSFQTVQPALASSDPGDNTQFVGINRPVVLTFNQPMARASVEAGVELLDPDGDAVAGSFAWSEGDRVATFRPASALELSSTYELVVPEGLEGASGGATRTERVVEFTTSDPPRVERSEPAAGSTNGGRWGFSLSFNNPMDIESVEERLSISGFDSEDLFIDWFVERELYVSVPLEPSTQYTVRIADGATDRDGLELGPYELRFRTGELPPR